MPRQNYFTCPRCGAVHDVDPQPGELERYTQRATEAFFALYESRSPDGDGQPSAVGHARSDADVTASASVGFNRGSGSEPDDSQPLVDPSPPQKNQEDVDPRVEPLNDCVAPAGSTAEQSLSAVTAAERTETSVRALRAMGYPLPNSHIRPSDSSAASLPSQLMCEDDWDEILDSIDASPRLNTAQHHALWEKIQRLKGSEFARVDPSPLALLDALLGQLASEQMQHLEAADRYDRAGDTAGNAHAELKAARICREHFEAVMRLRAALVAPTPEK